MNRETISATFPNAHARYYPDGHVFTAPDGRMVVTEYDGPLHRVELRWGQRLVGRDLASPDEMFAGLPETVRNAMRDTPVEAVSRELLPDGHQWASVFCFGGGCIHIEVDADGTVGWDALVVVDREIVWEADDEDENAPTLDTVVSHMVAVGLEANRGR